MPEQVLWDSPPAAKRAFDTDPLRCTDMESPSVPTQSIRAAQKDFEDEISTRRYSSSVSGQVLLPKATSIQLEVDFVGMFDNSLSGQPRCLCVV